MPDITLTLTNVPQALIDEFDSSHATNAQKKKFVLDTIRNAVIGRKITTFTNNQTTQNQTDLDAEITRLNNLYT